METKSKNDLSLKGKTLNQLLDSIVAYQATLQIRSVKRGSLKLSRQEAYTVNALGRSGSITMSMLARQLACSMSALTALTDRLVDQEIVTRHRQDTDRRVVKVQLTAKGKSIFAEHLKSHLNLSMHMLSALSEKDQDSLLRILNDVVKAFKTKAHTPT